MNLAPRDDLQGLDSRHGAHLALGLSGAWTLVIVCTIWLLPVKDADRSIVLALSAGAMVLALGLTRLPWERLPPRALLVFPALGVGSLMLTALLSRGISPSYTGYLTVAYVFMGLTQRPATIFATIPVVVPIWIICAGGFTPTDNVKLPVAVGIWVLIGESLAARTARATERTGELVAAASTDPLTGFLNRRELPRLLELLQPEDAVVLLDLDHFKRINDDLGHHAGDLVLADFGKTVRGALRSEDTALRYGGDEVLLVLAGQVRPVRTRSWRGYGRAGTTPLDRRSRPGWPSTNRSRPRPPPAARIRPSTRPSAAGGTAGRTRARSSTAG